LEGSKEGKAFLLRTISTIVLAFFVFSVIFFANIFIYSIVTIAFALLAIKEFHGMLKAKYSPLYLNVALVASLLLFFASFKADTSYLLYLLLFGLILIFLYQFTRRSNESACISVAFTFFSLIYITVPFIFFIKVRLLEYGARLIAYFIFVVKASDIGAYLVGIKYGRHPLIPRISPNKSIEGFIGAILFSLTAAYIGAPYIPVLSLRYIPAIGLILGILAQFGDLAESVLKRDCGFKDSGTTIPGLGGVLDLVDSLLLSLPFYYLYLHYIGLK